MMNNLDSDKIILRSVFNKADIKVYCNPAKEPKTNQYPKCVKSVNAAGDLILSQEELSSGNIWIKENEVFVLQDGITFDLKDPYDRAKWDAVRYNPLIADARDAKDSNGNLLIDGSPVRYGVAELYIERPELEATKRVSKKKLLLKAWSYIDEDEKGVEGRIMKAKMLGRDVSGMSDSDVTEYLLSYAETKPEMIIDLYTSPNTPIRMLLIDAKEMHLIYYKNGIYTYGDNVMLGATDQAAVAWLSDPSHKYTLKVIQDQLYPEFTSKHTDENALKAKSEEELSSEVTKPKTK